MSAPQIIEVPIFPLPAVQLFPGALLPLHVFEPRYRDLVKDCLEGDKQLAVAMFEPGFEGSYAGRPPVKSTIGVGQVIAHEPLPDGRSNILLRGTTRARIVDELAPTRSYRVVRATKLCDLYPKQTDFETARQTLVLLIDQLASRVPEVSATVREIMRTTTELGPLCDVVSAMLVPRADERQPLLEELDVAVRAERLTRHFAALLSTLTKGEGKN